MNIKDLRKRKAQVLDGIETGSFLETYQPDYYRRLNFRWDDTWTYRDFRRRMGVPEADPVIQKCDWICNTWHSRQKKNRRIFLHFYTCNTFVNSNEGNEIRVNFPAEDQIHIKLNPTSKHFKYVFYLLIGRRRVESLLLDLQICYLNI